MYLSTSDRQQLRRASEVMLHPFAHSRPIDFLKAVAAEVLPLLGGFAAICGTRDATGMVSIASDQWPGDTVQRFAEWKLRDDGTERAVSAGLQVAMMRRVVGDQWESYHADPMVQAWYKPNGVRDACAYVLHWPEDDTLATIEFHARTFGTPRFGEEGEELLHLLLPSLQAGMRVLYVLGRDRAQLVRALEVAGVAVCVCDRTGQVVQLSATLRDLVPDEGLRAALVLHAEAITRKIMASQRPARRGSGYQPPHAHELVATASGVFRLSAALAAGDMGFGASDVLVTIERLGHARLTFDQLADRYRFTRREAEVALLLREGRRNDAIATALAISPHTVRRHTEQILAKLGATSRAEAAALLQARE